MSEIPKQSKLNNKRFTYAPTPVYVVNMPFMLGQNVISQNMFLTLPVTHLITRLPTEWAAKHLFLSLIFRL